MEVNGYQYLINTVHLSAERRHSTSPPSFPPSGTTDLHSTPTWNGRPHLTGLIFRGATWPRFASSVPPGAWLMNIQVANPVTMGNAWISGFICYANALYAVPGTGT